MKIQQLLIIIVSLFFAACSQDAEHMESSEGLRVLYTVTWNGGYEKLSMVGSLDVEQAYVAPQSHWVATGDEKLIEITGQGMFSRSAPCPVSGVDHGVALCANSLYFAASHRELGHNFSQHIRALVPGPLGRLLYVLDDEGVLHVTDSKDSGAASDNGLLMLWGTRSSSVELISGNGKTTFGAFSFNGAVQSWTVKDELLHLLWFDNQRRTMGIATIDLADFSLVCEGVDIAVSARPTSLAHSDDGFAVAFDGAAPLLVDPETWERVQVPLDVPTAAPDRVFSFPTFTGLYFWSSQARTLTRVDSFSGEVISTQMLK